MLVLMEHSRGVHLRTISWIIIMAIMIMDGGYI